MAQEKKRGYKLVPLVSGKDSSINFQAEGIQTAFDSRTDALKYLEGIPGILSQRGFLAASVDSAWEESGNLHVLIFPGPKYYWGSLTLRNMGDFSRSPAGFGSPDFRGTPVNMKQLVSLQQRALSYLQNHGYPFAGISLDSVTIDGDKLNAVLVAKPSVLYHIDSIRLTGKLRLAPQFIHNYLGIPPHALYDKEKLARVDKSLDELPFVTRVQPSDLQMLGSGSVLNIYLDPRKNNRADFLVGILPDGQGSGKVQLTGDLLLDLKNTFGKGESIFVNWQQLQPKSPRLSLGFGYPYFLNSPMGIDFHFGLFRKDSNFLQINTMAGVDYSSNPDHKAKFFLQWQDNKLLEGGVDTQWVKANKSLPPNADLRSASLGVQYDLSATNYRLNPRQGNEMIVNMTSGIKKIRPNSQITGLTDANFDYASLYDSMKLESYLVRIRAYAAHYFPAGRASTLKLAVNTGLFQSPEIFRNELFQIGGFRILRGFDEESIYCTKYAVATAEFRHLVGVNSYLYFFSDAALVRNKYQNVNTGSRFISAGFGIYFQSGQGILSVCYAAGFRDDVSFRIGQASKLHFGYNYYF